MPGPTPTTAPGHQIIQRSISPAAELPWRPQPLGISLEPEGCGHSCQYTPLPRTPHTLQGSAPPPLSRSLPRPPPPAGDDQAFRSLSWKVCTEPLSGAGSGVGPSGSLPFSGSPTAVAHLPQSHLPGYHGPDAHWKTSETPAPHREALQGPTLRADSGGRGVRAQGRHSWCGLRCGRAGGFAQDTKSPCVASTSTCDAWAGLHGSF